MIGDPDDLPAGFYRKDQLGELVSLSGRLYLVTCGQTIYGVLVPAPVFIGEGI